MMDLRRASPRIDVEAMCWELIDGRETTSLAVDLSAGGLCVERPYTGGPPRPRVMEPWYPAQRDTTVPLQLEVPGIDEVMWARGDTCFDVLVASRSPAGGALGLVRRTGYRIVIAARRDLRMLEEFVVERWRARTRPIVELALASCYLRA